MNKLLFKFKLWQTNRLVEMIESGKRGAAHWLVAAGVFACLLAACAVSPAVAPDQAGLIIAYHAKTGSSAYTRSYPWIRFCVDTTDYWARVFGVQQYDEILLTHWEVETGYEPKGPNSVGCVGITQLNPSDIPYFYKVLKAHSPHPIPSLRVILRYPQYQIALGVAAWWCKLHDAHGDVWDAVRRYNGGGRAAARYRARVQHLYSKIFHRALIGRTAAGRPGHPRRRKHEKAVALHAPGFGRRAVARTGPGR